jgi:hypothetical protein
MVLDPNQVVRIINSILDVFCANRTILAGTCGKLFQHDLAGESLLAVLSPSLHRKKGQY